MLCHSMPGAELKFVLLCEVNSTKLAVWTLSAYLVLTQS